MLSAVVTANVPHTPRFYRGDTVANSRRLRRAGRVLQDTVYGDRSVSVRSTETTKVEQWSIEDVVALERAPHEPTPLLLCLRTHTAAIRPEYEPLVEAAVERLEAERILDVVQVLDHRWFDIVATRPDEVRAAARLALSRLFAQPRLGQERLDVAVGGFLARYDRADPEVGQHLTLTFTVGIAAVNRYELEMREAVLA